MTIIILLILTGIVLLVLEFFVFPGITLAALGGLLLIGGGVFLAYGTYGTTTGHWVLALSLMAALLVLVLALRSKTWQRLSLKTEVGSQIETVESGLQKGDKGICLTRLNPVGKVLVGEQEVEARCPDNYVDAGTDVEIVKVFKTYVTVKPLN
jgi:membrane-bound ClpP family serine protease